MKKKVLDVTNFKCPMAFLKTKEFIKLNTKELKDTTTDWSYFQNKWVDELIIILNQEIVG